MGTPPHRACPSGPSTGHSDTHWHSPGSSRSCRSHGTLCALWGEWGGQCQRAVEAGMAHCCVPMAQRPMGWAPRQLLHNPDPGLFPGPGAGEGGRWRGAPCPPGHPPAPQLLRTQDTHSFSSVSLLANWAGGTRRARGPRGSRGTHSTSLSTVTLSGERSQAQGGTSRGGKEGCGSDPDPARLMK